MDMADLISLSQAKVSRPAKFRCACLVMEEQLKKTRKDKDYRILRVLDSSGFADVTVWDNCEWFDQRDHSSEIKPLKAHQIPPLKGISVGFEGAVGEYNNSLQITASKMYILDQDKYPPLSFVPCSPIPRKELEDRFWALVRLCGGETLSFLGGVFEGARAESFFTLPAAVSNHHAYLSGLLEHTVSVAEVSLAMARRYGVRDEVVVAGALLHDLGKLRAYRMCPFPEVTVEGSVLDHIAMGYAMFEELADRHGLSDELRMNLGHIILSHHGKKEFGSPVVPATQEALIVAAADELDFNLFCCREGLGILQDGQVVSEYHRSAQRRFWSGELPEME